MDGRKDRLTGDRVGRRETQRGDTQPYTLGSQYSQPHLEAP